MQRRVASFALGLHVRPRTDQQIRYVRTVFVCRSMKRCEAVECINGVHIRARGDQRTRHACVCRIVKRRAVPRPLFVHIRARVKQEPHHVRMAISCRQVKRTARVRARVKQEPHHVRMAIAYRAAKRTSPAASAVRVRLIVINQHFRHVRMAILCRSVKRREVAGVPSAHIRARGD